MNAISILLKRRSSRSRPGADGRKRSALLHRLNRPPLLAQAFLVVVTADVAGLIVSAVTGLSSFSHSLLSGSAINAPFPFLAVQLIVATAAVRWRHRWAGMLAALLLVVSGAVSVLSGFADGSYSSSTVTAPDRGIQVTLIAATTLTVLIAISYVARALRDRAIAEMGSV